MPGSTWRPAPSGCWTTDRDSGTVKQAGSAHARQLSILESKQQGLVVELQLESAIEESCSDLELAIAVQSLLERLRVE